MSVQPAQQGNTRVQRAPPPVTPCAQTAKYVVQVNTPAQCAPLAATQCVPPVQSVELETTPAAPVVPPAIQSAVNVVCVILASMGPHVQPPATLCVTRLVPPVPLGNIQGLPVMPPATLCAAPVTPVPTVPSMLAHHAQW